MFGQPLVVVIYGMETFVSPPDGKAPADRASAIGASMHSEPGAYRPAAIEIEQMDASVACAVWLPHAATAAEAHADAAHQTFWHTSVRRAPDGTPARSIAELLSWFDTARMIVAYKRWRVRHASATRTLRG